LRLARVCCVPPVWGERKSPLRSWISYIPLAAVGMLLDAADPSIVLARSAEPLLAPETDDERSGIVPNVVFPTAIEQIEGQHYVFYGMADSKIGVARLDRA
jgi:predicted GH43/DUF377 family glycosyl hydrolase